MRWARDLRDPARVVPAQLTQHTLLVCQAERAGAGQQRVLGLRGPVRAAQDGVEPPEHGPLARRRGAQVRGTDRGAARSGKDEHTGDPKRWVRQSSLRAGAWTPAVGRDAA